MLVAVKSHQVELHVGEGLEYSSKHSDSLEECYSLLSNSLVSLETDFDKFKYNKHEHGDCDVAFETDHDDVEEHHSCKEVNGFKKPEIREVGKSALVAVGSFSHQG